MSVPGHHPIEGTDAPLIHSIGIVHRPGSIDRQTNEELVLFEELGPPLVQQHPVGLDRIGHPLVWLAIYLYVALLRVFGDDSVRTLLKFLLISLSYSVALAAVLLASVTLAAFD